MGLKTIEVLLSLAAVGWLATEVDSQSGTARQTYSVNPSRRMSCQQYCSSRLMGTTHCCPTTTGTITHSGIVPECYYNRNIDCGVQQLPPVVYQQPPRQDIYYCGDYPCERRPVPVTPRPTRIWRPSYCGYTSCGTVGTRRAPKLCRSESLSSAIESLVLRSYANSYTLKTFVDGLQAIIDNEWEYSWFGVCTTRAPSGNVEPKTGLTAEEDEVDVFDDDLVPTSDAHCYSCSTTSYGVRRCSTRLQTILGACDNCCSSYSTSRTGRRVSRSPGTDNRTDLRDKVSSLLQRAPNTTRRIFLAELKAIVRNALADVYRWNQFHTLLSTASTETPPQRPVPTADDADASSSDYNNSNSREEAEEDE